MKLGFCSWLLADLRMPDVADFLHREGFQSMAFLPNVTEMDESERAELVAALKELNFTVTYHSNVQKLLDPEKHFDTKGAEKMFQDVLRWQRDLGTVHSCCSDCVKGPEVLEGECIRLMELEHDIFEETAIGYGLENSCAFSALDGLQKWRDAVPDSKNAGMILDCGHAHVYLQKNGVKTSMFDYVRQIPLKIHEVHLTDNHGNEDEHLPPGRGTLDFSGLADALVQRQFDGVLSLEMCPNILAGEYGWHLKDSKAVDTIRYARDWVQEKFRELECE